ncbi:MAG: RNA methyltransferase [bacterium]|nr:RNA methyltransferase [Bacillota bacterium]HHW56021.1 RNA methyltransferase [Bacillota bacterium]
MKEIRSLTNPRLKYARSLHRRRYREQEGKCLVEGVRLLEDAVAAGVEIETVFYTDRLLARERGRQLLQECQGRGSSCYRLPEAVLASLAETESPQGVVAVVKYPQWERETLLVGPGLLLLVDRIQDPGNLGTMLRTAEAAGCRGAILSPGTVDPYNSKVLRSSMGAVFRLPILTGEAFPALLEELQERGYQLVAADIGGSVPYWEADLRLPGALVVGNEAWGVGKEILAQVAERVRIPLKEGVDSLNAAVAAGIILYEWVRQGGIIPGGI